MQQINRLLYAAKKAAQGTGAVIFGFIDYCEETAKCRAYGTIYGVPGKDGDKFSSVHDTEADAHAALDEVAAQYPNADAVNFIIDDMSFPGAV